MQAKPRDINQLEATQILTALFGNVDDYNEAIEVASNPNLDPQPTEARIQAAKDYLKKEDLFVKKSGQFQGHPNPTALVRICSWLLGFDSKNFLNCIPGTLEETKKRWDDHRATILAALKADPELLRKLKSTEEQDLEFVKKAPDLTFFVFLSGDLHYFADFVEAARANKELKDSFTLNACYSETGVTLMHLAIMLRVPGFVNYLIEQKVSYGLKTKSDPVTPLELAVQTNPSAVKEFLGALDEPALSKVANNVTNAPEDIRPIDLLSYYLSCTSTEPGGEKPVFDKEIFLLYLELCAKVIDLQVAHNLEQNILAIPEAYFDAKAKKAIIDLLRDKNPEQLKQLSERNKKKASDARKAAEATAQAPAQSPTTPQGRTDPTKPAPTSGQPHVLTASTTAPKSPPSAAKNSTTETTPPALPPRPAAKRTTTPPLTHTHATLEPNDNGAGSLPQEATAEPNQSRALTPPPGQSRVTNTTTVNVSPPVEHSGVVTTAAHSSRALTPPPPKQPGATPTVMEDSRALTPKSAKQPGATHAVMDNSRALTPPPEKQPGATNAVMDASRGSPFAVAPRNTATGPRALNFEPPQEGKGSKGKEERTAQGQELNALLQHGQPPQGKKQPKSVVPPASAKAETPVLPEETRTLQWRLMLAATALLKDSKNIHQRNCARIFQFIAENDKPRAQRLLSRLQEIAKEKIKPELSNEHLYILAGNPHLVYCLPEKNFKDIQGLKRVEVTDGFVAAPLQTEDSNPQSEIKAPNIQTVVVETSNNAKKEIQAIVFYDDEDQQTDDNSDETPSQPVSYKRVIDVITFLKETNFLRDTLATTKDGRTVLHWAAISGSYLMMDEVLKAIKNLRKTNPGLKASTPDLNSRDKQDNTPVHEAALAGSYRLRLNKQPTQHNFDGITYQMPANVPIGITDAAKELYALFRNNKDEHQVANPANFKARNKRNQLPLHLAILNGPLSFLGYVVEASGNLILDMGGDGQKMSMLHYASIKGVPMAKLKHIATAYVAEGVTLETTDAEGFTSLHWACASINLPAQLVLLSLGADPNPKNDPRSLYAATPLSLSLSAQPGKYDRRSKAMWVKMCPRIKGLHTLLTRDGVNPSDFDRVFDQSTLLVLSHLLFNQGLDELNSKIRRAAYLKYFARYEDTIYSRYFQACEQNRRDPEAKQVFLEKFFGSTTDEFLHYPQPVTEEVFHQKHPSPILTLEEYKAHCLKDGHAELGLDREQYKNLLLACHPGRDNDKDLEIAMREYVLAPIYLFRSKNVTAEADQLSGACLAARKKYYCVQRRADFLKLGPTPELLGASTYDDFRRDYLDDADIPLAQIVPPLQKAQKVFLKMMTNYIAVGGSAWEKEKVVKKGADGSNIEIDEYAYDVDGKRIPTGRWLRYFANPFRHVDVYGPIAEKSILAIEPSIAKTKPLSKAEVLQLMEDTFAEAQKAYIHNDKIGSDDIKTSDFFNMLLTTLTMTYQVEELGNSQVAQLSGQQHEDEFENLGDVQYDESNNRRSGAHN